MTEEVAGKLRERFGEGAHFAFIAPAVTRTRLQHLAGIPDEARVEAEERIEASQGPLEDAGLEPDTGVVGDQDPVIAIEDAIREFPDLQEVVLITHTGDDERWAEQDAFDRIRQRVGIPVTLLEVDREGHLVDTERSDPGVDSSEDVEVEGGGNNLPRFALHDWLAIFVAIFGTIALLVIAAANIDLSGESDASEDLGFGGVLAALLAIGFFLINVWHVIGLVLTESVGYRGLGTRIISDISLYGTPIAVVIALIATL